MKILLALLLLLPACAGTDLAPDEFGIDVGRGNTDFNSSTSHAPSGWWDPNPGSSTTGDAESTYLGFHLTWKIGDVAQRQREGELLEALYGIRNEIHDKPQPAATVIHAPCMHPPLQPAQEPAAPQPPAKAPEPKPPPPDAAEGREALILKLLLALVTATAAVISWLSRRGTVTFLAPQPGKAPEHG